MEENVKPGLEGCGCKSAGGGCGASGCRCGSGGCGSGGGCGCGRSAGKAFAGLVLLLLGGVIGFLMGTHGCHHSMGMMSCPYTTAVPMTPTK